MFRAAIAVQDFLRDRKGTMTVEFVATIPLLLVALVFSFEFGKALWAYDVVTRDVRGGVRYISRAASLPPSDCGTSVQNFAETGSPTGTTTHFPWTGTATFTCSSASVTGSNYSQSPISIVTMTANVPITLSLLGFLCNNAVRQFCIPTSYTLVVSDQVRWVGN